MSDFTVGVTILLLLFFWKHAWQKTLLDTSRDHLFDLRDELRLWFIEKGYGLEHPVYQELRNMINRYLLHTEKLTVSSFIAFCYFDAKGDEYDRDALKKFDTLLRTDDARLAEYISKVRKKASSYVVYHMTFKNFFLTFLIISLVILTCLYEIAKLLFAIIRDKVPFSQISKEAVSELAFETISSTPFIKNSGPAMEKYSLENEPHQFAVV